jgi:hypothetical protein
MVFYTRKPYLRTKTHQLLRKESLTPEYYNSELNGPGGNSKETSIELQLVESKSLNREEKQE